VAAESLPELAAVHWRPRADGHRLDRTGRLWTLSTAAHVVPFIGAGVALFVVEPLAAPVSLASFAHAWVIPELYAQRGANVIRPKPSRAEAVAEERSMGLLGDLVSHQARALHAQTGLILERGRLGVWLLGPAGALLVRDRGRRVLCYCVGVTDRELPTGDRIAHLLLALRSDEEGFATVANLAFSGARWRVRRRISPEMRPALDAAVDAAKQVRHRGQGPAEHVLPSGPGRPDPGASPCAT
jgi:hypothetical protein